MARESSESEIDMGIPVTAYERFIAAAIAAICSDEPSTKLGFSVEKLEAGDDDPNVVVARQALIYALVEKFGKVRALELAERFLSCSPRFFDAAYVVKGSPAATDLFNRLLETAKKAGEAATKTRDAGNNYGALETAMFRTFVAERRSKHPLARRSAYRALALILRFSWKYNAEDTRKTMGRRPDELRKMVEAAVRDYGENPDFRQKVHRVLTQFELEIEIPSSQ